MATMIDRNAAPAPMASHRSAVNWAPVFAGAAVAIALTIVLLALGSGLGFAVASPWPGASPSATTFAIGAGIWLIVTQWLSSFLGGYITGRLRTRWTAVHTDEVLFRDTAHGLLAWAVATVIVAGIALNATMSQSATSGAASEAVTTATDTLLRTGHPRGDLPALAARAEVARMLARHAMLTGDDRTYLASEVATQTGLSQSAAQQRVDEATQSLRSAADTARKASSALGFFTALSMLLGAFIASVASAYGGRLRDDHEAGLAPR